MLISLPNILYTYWEIQATYKDTLEPSITTATHASQFPQKLQMADEAGTPVV